MMKTWKMEMDYYTLGNYGKFFAPKEDKLVLGVTSTAALIAMLQVGTISGINVDQNIDEQHRRRP